MVVTRGGREEEMLVINLKSKTARPLSDRFSQLSTERERHLIAETKRRESVQRALRENREARDVALMDRRNILPDPITKFHDPSLSSMDRIYDTPNIPMATSERRPNRGPAAVARQLMASNKANRERGMGAARREDSSVNSRVTGTANTYEERPGREVPHRANVESRTSVMNRLGAGFRGKIKTLSPTPTARVGGREMLRSTPTSTLPAPSRLAHRLGPTPTSPSLLSSFPHSTGMESSTRSDSFNRLLQRTNLPKRGRLDPYPSRDQGRARATMKRDPTGIVANEPTANSSTTWNANQPSQPPPKENRNRESLDEDLDAYMEPVRKTSNINPIVWDEEEVKGLMNQYKRKAL